MEVADPARLLAVRAGGLLDTPPEEGFDRLTRIASRLLETPTLISLVDADRQFFKSQHGLPERYATTRQTPLSHSFCQHVVTSGRPFVVEDARLDARVKDNQAVPELGVIAYAGVPLRAPGGAVIGSLCAIGYTPRTWTDADVTTLSDIAEIASSEISLRHEIAERKRAEQGQFLLIRELNHRVRNTLATVQAVIQLSLASAPSMESFRESIGARIASLARVHTMLADQQWSTTTFREVLANELEPYQKDGQIEMTGPELRLSSESAVILAMVLHELTTNASKYGALSGAKGRVRLNWTLSHNANGQRLALDWRESGGPALSAPGRGGFGTLLLNRLLKGPLQGNISFDPAPDGMRVRLEAMLPA
jgi:two-component sensor histidine kinase